MFVEPRKNRGVQDVGRGHVTLQQDTKQLENQNQNVGLLLNDEFLNQDPQDVGLDNGLDPERKLCQVDEAAVGVVPDLLDGVVKELGGYVDQRVLNENDATHFGASDLKHRA